MKSKMEILKSCSETIRSAITSPQGFGLISSFLFWLVSFIFGIDIVSSLIIAVLGGFVHYFIAESAKSIKKNTGKLETIKNIIEPQISEITDKIQQIKEKIEIIEQRIKNFTENAIEIATIGSNRKVFQFKLNALRKQEGGAMWIMSKFIAKQLAEKFEKFQFSIDGDGYTRFSAELYGEVNNSLFLTSSFNPYEWAKTLWTKNDLFNELDSLIKSGETLIKDDGETNEKYKDFLMQLASAAPHLTAWKNLSPTSDKKRIIVLHRNEWNNFFVYKPYFSVFKKISGMTEGDDHTRFLIFEHHQELLGSGGLNVDVKDYAVYDGTIILQWDSPLEEKDKTALELLPLEMDGNADEELWKRINELKNNWDTAKSLNDLENSISQGKKNLVDNLRNDFLNHSLCYYADGGNCWKEINEDTTYTLGEEEQKFILPFIDAVWGNVLDTTRRYDILHIGIGCGKETENIVRGIQKSRLHKDTGGINIDQYILADISQRVLSIMREKINRAENNSPLSELQEKGGRSIIDTICVDVFEKEFVKKVEEKRQGHTNPLIVVLVANGYLLSHQKILNNIHRILRDDNDILLVTTENGRTSIETIRASYTIESVLKLFNVSLNLIEIDTIDNKYFNFDFSDLPKAAPKGPSKDVFVGEFDISTWINDHSDSCSPLVADLSTPISFFRSYKPKTLKSITDYLGSCGLELGKTSESKEQIYGESRKDVDLIKNLDAYSGCQIGLVIKKKK